MAAELFRARFSTRPFISPFLIAGSEERKLHIFTNCQRSRILRDGVALAELGQAWHHVIDLEEEFNQIVVEGELDGTTAVETIRSWGAAATLGLSFDQAEARPGRTIAIDISLLDGSGVPVRDWNGKAALSVEGNAQLLAFNKAGEVKVSKGEGRVYLRLGTGESDVLITAAAKGTSGGSTVVAMTDQPSSL